VAAEPQHRLGIGLHAAQSQQLARAGHQAHPGSRGRQLPQEIPGLGLGAMGEALPVGVADGELRQVRQGRRQGQARILQTREGGGRQGL